MASPDILVLSEIYDNDQDNATRTNEELDTAFELLRQNDLHDWDYALLTNKVQGDKSQLCAVAWNRKRIERIGDALRIDVSDPGDPHNCWDRHPHAIKFSRGENLTDIVVVPLHMKANPGPSQDNSAEVEQREHEAQLLVERKRFCNLLHGSAVRSNSNTASRERRRVHVCAPIHSSRCGPDRARTVHLGPLHDRHASPSHG